MRPHKRKIKYKKERVIISDVLPYEIPLTFSNRHLYDFIVKYKIELNNEKILWKNGDSIIGEIVKLLFGIKKEKPILGRSVNIDSLTTIPFGFKISHKESDFRELTIIHPKNQLALIAFYEKYKELIMHYSSISQFSIRRAVKVSKFRYYKDKTHRINLATGEAYDSTEENDREYENLKTFFVYKNYSNIHKFYESYKYHRCEKKYNNLVKFDVSKCFDSIYTHSICWALLNKDIVKSNINQSGKTFGGEFDKLMQNLNYNETNGIVIGPEFSRVFAELILQKIDCNVEKIVRGEKVLHKQDYEVFRYVDDFFVFYNDPSTIDIILQTYRLQFKEYKLTINDAKTILYKKPLITEITIAKQKISNLLNKTLVYDLTTLNEGIEGTGTKEGDLSKRIGGDIYVSSNKLITQFKTIIKETGIEYKDILNFTLSIIERKVFKILKDYHSADKKPSSERNIVRAILEILDFIFFIYAVSPRVNTTIKLCRILRRISEFVSLKTNVNIDFKHLLQKKIYDNIYFILHKNKTIKHVQVETLYLLITLSELGKEYWLESEVLCSYFNIDKDENGRQYVKEELNYFSITVLLFYIKDKKRYLGIKECIKSYTLQKLSEGSKDSIRKNTENILLLFDLIVCPYLDQVFKDKLFRLFEIIDPITQEKIIKERKYWFTKWSNFEIGKELDTKQGLEVY